MSSETILIVDDSPLIRQVVTDAFRPAGYKVVTAADGSEALRLISEERPDLIVADILMPVMDGWRLCEEVRRCAETALIPFIFLTTEKEAKKKVRGLRMGADDYVTKPFSAEELVARAERILERARRINSAAAAGDELSGHTRHLSMADLLQILSLNARTGTLRIDAGTGLQGKIHFRDGRIVHAEIGPVEGEKALFRMMMWPESRFVLEDLPREVPETIRASTSNVLMEGFTHWDELRYLEEELPPRTARYRLRPQVAGFIQNIEMTPVERRLVEGFAEKATLGDLLDAMPQRDLEIYRALLGLVDKGFLEALGQEEADTQPMARSDGSA